MNYHEQVEAEWKMQKARERKQRETDLYNLDKVAEKEWLHFCFWCNCEHAITIPNTGGKIDVEQMKAKVYNNEDLFNKYYQKEKPNGYNRFIEDFHINRRIFEIYFGYEFKFDEQENRLKYRKKKLTEQQIC